ncbi:hypothetical protein BKA70DRAFT_1435424 [Coprinopsis sp. MPI-PUGE-AT-0042]|nr:hypothetical protein BKA70DRAFT_1435424 [Coprinopsis sp. MPI-PUGE-AT-0042]
MPSTDFEPGIYTVVSSKTPNLVLDARDGKAIVNQFMGIESQQWEMSQVLGLAWSFRSIATGRYLGMKPDDKVTNRYELREVPHPFAWHLRRGNPASRIFVVVPYTNHVIDLNQENGNPKPGTALYVFEKHGGLHQQWNLCKDLHLATARTLVDGAGYRIVNAQSQTAIERKRVKVWSSATQGVIRLLYDYSSSQWHASRRIYPRLAKRYVDHLFLLPLSVGMTASRCMQFIAVEMSNGWAFRNVDSQSYLGLPNSVVPLPDGVRLCTAKKEFTWVVLPHHEDNSKFRIWIPFTSRVMDLHAGSNQDDTAIHLHKENGADCQWWKFELIPSQST